ncbi:MAG: hypothetical protein HKL82_03570 [Acidimicrobiaceae bacterium]|nr:hypothetical protein [Acidimicrobiaceae bacterium]
MLASFLIFLREGIEASMIVAILLAYLDKVGRREYFRYVVAGVVSALVFAAVVGTIIYVTVHDYAGTNLQTEIETATYLLATVVMTYMTFWMRSHAKDMSRELRDRTDVVLGRGAKVSMALMAFQAVGRECLEAMVFTLAIVFSSSVVGASVGAGVGTIISLAFAYTMYRLGHRVNIARAFKVLGVALMFFAAGLLVDAVQNLQQLGWIHFMNHALWNSTSLLSDQSTLGDVAHSFFGYASQPTSLQLVSYLAYLGITISLFLAVGKRSQSAKPKALRNS